MKPAKETKAVKHPYQRAAHNILHTAGWLQNKMIHTLRGYDLSEPQYNVLRILHGQNGTAMNLFEIQELMAQKDSNVSRIIDKLCDKQFVVRRVSKTNKRKVDIVITQKGVKALDVVNPAMEKMLSEIFEGVKKEKMKTLSKMLDSLMESHM